MLIKFKNVLGNLNVIEVKELGDVLIFESKWVYSGWDGLLFIVLKYEWCIYILLI